MMTNGERRFLSHRLFSFATVLFFCVRYLIGCVENNGNSNASAVSDRPIDVARTDCGSVVAGQDSSAGSNTTISPSPEGEPVATSTGLNNDLTLVDNGHIAASQGGRSGSKDVGGAVGMTAGTDGAGIEGTGGNNVILSAVKSISSGGGYLCLLKIDGSVVCWGQNDFGQAEAPSGSFTQISTAGSNACALSDDGSVVCWGRNDFGQAEAPSGSFVQVSAGEYSSYAIRQDGSITCWGSCEFQPNAPSSGFYVQVSNRLAGVPICAVSDDGKIVCWGTSEVVFGNTAPDGCYTHVDGNCAIRCDGTYPVH